MRIRPVEEAVDCRPDWRIQELWSALDMLLPGISVEVVAQAESTNSALVERVRLSSGGRAGRAEPAAQHASTAGAVGALGRRSLDAQPCLLVAEHQTRGRGRLGRAWASAPGASLTFSLSLPLNPVDWSGLPLAVGVVLARALDPEGCDAQPRLLLKWPNDLWLRDPSLPLGARKLGGVLIETVPAGGRRMCVVGVGVNMLPQRIDGLSAGYASWAELEPQASASLALWRVALPLARALRDFETGGFAAFCGEYARRDALFGAAVQVTQGEVGEGVAQGVDARGALRVLCSDGRTVLLNSGEVSVRPLQRSGFPG